MMKLLEEICNIHAPSGEEINMKNFLLKHIKANQKNWRKQPEIIVGEEFQDNIILVFGNPRTAIFSHMDSIGFTVKYNNEIIKIGGPVIKEGYTLTGKDKDGSIEGNIIKKNDKYFIDFSRTIERGTSLTFKANFRNSKNFIQSCYMDNRLGVWNCLEVAKNLNDGIIVFSSWEEHGGGSIGYLGKYIYEKYKINQALISDITWITEGISHGKGVVISMRDSAIPRRSYVNKIIEIANNSEIPFQIEVENAGGSDGNSLQRSPYPWNWCFIGAAEDNVHSPNEKVHKNDIKSMVEMYNKLMEVL